MTSAPGLRRAGWRHANRWLLAIGAGLVLAFAAIAWVQWRQISLLSDSVRYEGDNLAWSFFQLESEYLQLRDGLREAQHHAAGEQPLGADEAAELRQRFELFASRLPLVSTERTARFVDFGASHVSTLGQVQAYIQRQEPLLAEAAATPLTPRRLAPALAELAPLHEPIHELSLLANQVIAEQVGRRNDAVRDQTRLGIGLTVFQSLLTLLFATLTARQFRTLARRRRELEQLADTLQDARIEAESASQAKSAFLANMSHELRTPFNGMMGMLALLQSSQLSLEQADQVHTARESAQHLLELLNDILDISKLESGRLDITPHPLDLHRLLDEVQLLMQLSAEAKGLSLTLQLAPDVPRQVVADGKRLKQILFNLMSNAVKFTDQGRVQLTVTCQAERPGAASADGLHALCFAVSDTGIGMDAAMQARLFQRFSQGDASTSRRYGGTGLGLEISRSLARLMNGDILVASQAGAGSTFSLLLQLPDCPALPEPVPAVAAPPSTPGGPPLDLLVADDHPVNRKFMQILLQRMGHQVRLVGNGAEAVQAVHERRPDLVFMDLHMPVLDGLSATQRLRALPPPASEVPIVALTADAFRETRERVAAVGMNNFLAKPVQPDDIEAVLAQHFGPRARAAAPTTSQAEPSGPTHTRTPPPDASGSAPPPRPDSFTEPTMPAAAPAPATPRRRFRAGDVAAHLDMTVIGDVCVGVSMRGYSGLLQSFLSDESGSIGRLQATLAGALEPGNPTPDSLKADAHAVKGVSASLGLKALHALARDLESQAEAGSSTPQARAEAATQLRELVETARALCERMGFI